MDTSINLKRRRDSKDSITEGEWEKNSVKTKTCRKRQFHNRNKNNNPSALRKLYPYHPYMPHHLIPLPLELGARIELLEPLQVFAHLVTCTEHVASSRLELQSGPGRHVWLCSLWQWFRRNSWACLLLLRVSPPVLGSRREWTARIEPKQLVMLDIGYVVDNVLTPFLGEKRVVFLAILAVARMVIWTTRKKGLYDDANFSHRDLVLYFRNQLRVKIRCDRKRLDCITFDKRWVNAASQVVRKGATLESSFPPLPAHGVYGTGPSGPHPR